MTAALERNTLLTTDIYDPLDRTHAQLNPEAYEIVTRNGGRIEPGRMTVPHPDPNFAGIMIQVGPNFRGLTEQWWKDLAYHNPVDFERLVRICMDDFPTYCALLLFVVSRLDDQLHTFIFNNGQLIVWNAMVARMLRGEPCFFVVLKARQLGITTFVAAWHFWNLWRASDRHALDVGSDEKVALRVVDFFRVFYDHLPDVGDLRPKLRTESKSATIPRSELYFSDNRSQGEIHIAKNFDPIGNTSRFIGEHEAAFYPDLESFNDKLMPQLPSVGSPARAKCSMIIESTPNGQNQFYEAWEETKEEGSEFWGIILPWIVADDEYTAVAPSEWRLTGYEKTLQEQLSLLRRRIDGKDVSREQMYWRHLTLKNKPFSGNEEAFNEAYPSDDETCFQLRSESVFRDSITWLHECVTGANLRAKRAWSQRMDTRGEAIEVDKAVTGELAYKPLHSPFETIHYLKLEKPRFVIKDGGPLWVWNPPIRDHLYFIGADVAAGELRRDESVAQVVDLTLGLQVAEFASRRHKPEDFADILVHLCMWYNRAMIMPEVNGLGSVVMKRMTGEWGYQNLAHEEKWDEMGVKRNKPGFYTSERNRPMIFSSLVYMIEERFLVLSSSRLLKQMSTFKKEGMDYRTAKKGQHDDRVVAMGLACIGIRQAPKYMGEMLGSRAARAPSAVELGLNHSPATAPRIRNDRDHIAEAIFGGLNAYDIPQNPLRGPSELY